MLNRQLNSFLPPFYENIVEMDDIINSEEQIMDVARQEMAAAFANTFVLTSDESGVIMFEKMLNIVADTQTETLEFRRQRVVNRLSMRPPFTFRFLQQKLNEIIGIDAWKAYIDFDNYTLYIESSAVNQSWHSEVEFTINRVKPCNMVFINVPYTAEHLSLSEQISYTTPAYKYRLDSWRLGQYPFVTLSEGGIIKMAETKSIQQPLLNDTADFVADNISAVLLNDKIRITEFKLKEVEENVISVEYTVTNGMTGLITDVKLINAEDEVLTHTAVYVPVTQSVICKHTITIKEGV